MEHQEDTPERESWDDPQRWKKPVPPPPRIPADRRRDLAREWLEFLGCEVTDDRVEELSAVVMRYHPLSPKGQVANQLVQNGVTPYRKVVEDEFRTQQRRRDQLMRQHADSLLDSPEQVDTICRFIATHRRRTGAGPLWREVAEDLEVDQDAVAIVLTELKERGSVIFTDQTRSLDVT